LHPSVRHRFALSSIDRFAAQRPTREA